MEFPTFLSTVRGTVALSAECKARAVGLVVILKILPRWAEILCGFVLVAFSVISSGEAAASFFGMAWLVPVTEYGAYSCEPSLG